MSHKGTGYCTNPIDDAKERYLHESKPIKARIAYCGYNARHVGAMKHRARWARRAAEAHRDLHRLERRMMESLDARG